MNEILKGNQWTARKIENNYIVNLDDQSDITKSLEDFILKQNLKEGQFSGIGFLEKMTVKHFDPALERYIDKEFTGLIVVFDLYGSISNVNNETLLDIRISFKINDEKYVDHQLIKGKVYEKIDLIFYSSSDKKISFMNNISNLDFNDFSYN